MGKTGEGRWTAGEPGDMLVKIQAVLFVALFPLLSLMKGFLETLNFHSTSVLQFFVFYN